MQTGAVKSYYEKSGKSHDEALIAAIAVMDAAAADLLRHELSLSQTN